MSFEGKRSKTAAIIPAFNEEKTIADVVRVLVSSSVVDEVIVVSDGSTDNTVQRAQEAGADKVLHLPKNKGKGAALLHGVTHTNAPVIAFFDADLRGLTEDHVDRVYFPVLSGSKVMNVGFRDKGKFITKLLPYLPLIGGERAMRRTILMQIPPEYIQGFMIESALNYYCRTRKLRYGHVFLPGLSMMRKYEKVGWVQSLKEYVTMSFEVVKAMIIVRLAHLFKRF